MNRHSILIILFIFLFVSCQKNRNETGVNAQESISLYELESEKAAKLDKPENHYQNKKVHEQKSFPDGKIIKVISYLNPHECIVTMENMEKEEVLLKQEEPRFNYQLIDGRNENEIIAVLKRAECLFYIYIITSDGGVVKTIRTALYADYYNSIITMREDGHLLISSNTMSGDSIVSVDLDTGVSTLELFKPSEISAVDMRRDVFNDTKKLDYYSENNKYISIDKENNIIDYDILGYELSENLDMSVKSDVTYLKLHGKEYVLLCNDYFCFLINDNDKLVFHGNSFHAMTENVYKAELSYSISPERKEESGAFALESLGQIEDGNGFEIIGDEGGERSAIQLKSKTDISGILFFNGHISFNNPTLYKKHARVKTIQIIDNSRNESYTINLEDTPNPQYITFLPSNNFSIKILEIYPGNEGESLYINAIIGIDEKYGYFI